MMTLQRTFATFATALLLVGAGMAQGKYGATPEDSITCVQNLSLYQEFMKQKAYDDAIGPWRMATEVCPNASKALYVNGVKLLKHFVANTKDAAEKTKLIGEMYGIYDKRIEHFGQRGFVLGRKGVDMLKYTPERTEDVFNTLKMSIDDKGAKSEAGVLAAYYQALYNMHKEDKATKEQLITEYVVVMDHIDANLSQMGGSGEDEEGEGGGSDKAKYYEQAKENVNQLFFQVAECPDIEGIISKLVKERPDDKEFKRSALKIMSAKDCTESDVYRSVAEAVHQDAPTDGSAYALSMVYVKLRNWSKANSYMREALDLCTDCPDKAKYLEKAGQIASASGDHGSARRYANMMLQSNPNNGEAYILIGNAILAQAGECAEPENWKVYWLAYDYFARAKSLDGSVSGKASEKMGACSSRFPESGQAFFHQLSNGQAVTATCGGLNESTTVRTK